MCRMAIATINNGEQKQIVRTKINTNFGNIDSRVTEASNNIQTITQAIEDIEDIIDNIEVGIPTGGIERANLAQDVRDSLDLADSALQTLPTHNHSKADLTDIDLITDGAGDQFLGDDGEYHEIQAGGGGTTNHASLFNLGYAQSGHTGFASSADITELEDEIDITNGQITTINGRITTIEGNILTINTSIGDINIVIGDMQTAMSALTGAVRVEPVASLASVTTPQENTMYMVGDFPPDVYMWVNNDWFSMGPANIDLTLYAKLTDLQPIQDALSFRKAFTFEIPVTAWEDGSTVFSGHRYSAELPIVGLLAGDMVNAPFDNFEIAESAGVRRAGRTINGAAVFYSRRVPASSLHGTASVTPLARSITP